MARISGVDIPSNKRVVVSLTYIYGIGRPTSEEILKNANVSEDKRVKDLSEAELTAFTNYFFSHLIHASYFFLLATVLAGPFLVRAFVLVLCPLTGKPLL